MWVTIVGFDVGSEKTAVKTAMGLALAASLFLTVGARAATITQSFTLTVSPAATLPSGDPAFASSPFAEFNPADGTLTGISATLTGKGTWDAQTPFDLLLAALAFNGTHEEVAPGRNFNSNDPGSQTISLDFSGTDDFGPDLSLLTGTSTTVLDLVFFGEPGDTVATSTAGLAGSITYDYAPVPEPATWATMLAGFFSLGAVLRRRREHGPATGLAGS
jgi:hypothetical protein